jgi:anti-sigma-K factor RskA
MTPNRAQPEDGRSAVDWTEPMQVASRVMEVEGDIRLLSQQVTMGLKIVTDQQASMQGDIREIERVARNIESQQHEIQSHSTGLERLAKAIEKHVDQQERRWEKQETENKAVADRVNFWRGIVIGISLLAGLLLSAGIYIVNSRFDDAAKERVRIDSRLDHLEARP